MKYIIDDGVLIDIIWEDDEGTVLTVPDGVEVIDTQFKITKKVDTIILPNSIKEINAYALMDPNCSEIEIHNLYYNGTLSEWCAIDKGLHENWGEYVSMGMYGYNLYVQDDTGKYQIVDNPKIEDTNIKPICFYGCASLESVSIYSSKISEDAFKECRNLKKVLIYGASTELIDNFLFGDISCPFDNREDLEIAFSMEAMNNIFGYWECGLLDYDNPLTVIETGDDIREIRETVENIDDNSYERTNLKPDSPISEIYYNYVKLTVQDELYDEYDSQNEEEEAEEAEDRIILGNAEDAISYESYDDLYKLYEYVSATHELFLPYRAKVENILCNCDKLIANYEYDFFADRQLEKLSESIKFNILTFEERKGKSADIYHIIESDINDILDASDRYSENSVFNINDIDYDEMLLEPLYTIVHYIEEIEEYIEHICNALNRSEELVLEELETEETDIWRKLNEQKELLEELSGEVSAALVCISDAFREIEENLCNA